VRIQRKPSRDAPSRCPTVVVPVHAGRDMAKGTLRNILAITGMDAEEFRKLL
jgi:predicted RNA binding protein YcfA (HicA-like mRNA interferase family)